MIDGINSTSYRDKWTASNLYGDSVNETEDGEATEKIWNAVFTDEKKNAVSADDFLSLMVAQLKNQDFMNPVDDTQYVTQLAQFSTMQQMQEMANYTKTSYVMSLVGKNVTAARMTVSGNLTKETGPVQKITLADNEFGIYVNDKKFTLEQIMQINDGNTVSSETTTPDTTTTDTRKNYLLSLMGKQVTISEKAAGSEDDTLTLRIEGVVEKVSSENGKYRVYVADGWHMLDDVVEVGAQAAQV